MKTDRRTFLQLLGAAGLGLGLPDLARRASAEESGGAASAQQPNILLLFPDQWRRPVLGCNGDPFVRTPNIDRLAAQGVNFTRGYANYPVCTPCRSMLMTGRYPHQLGICQNNIYLHEDSHAFAHQLNAAGYHTGYIGKWHLDGHARPGFVPPERRQGWKVFQGFNRGHWYDRHGDKVEQTRYFTNEGELVYSDQFESVVQTDLALDFIRKRPADQPFALMLSYGPPHSPYTPPPEYLRMKPEDVPWQPNVTAEDRKNPGLAGDLAGYYGLCELVDEQIGRVLTGLREQGIEENTIVVFCSDHGDMLGSHGSQGKFQKDVPYEESVGIPFIVRGPGVQAGVRNDTLVSILDLTPTLLGLAGAQRGPQMLGRDVAPLLRGGTIDAPWLYNEGWLQSLSDQWRSIVTRTHKLVLMGPPGDPDAKNYIHNGLYDLEHDPFEMNNLFDRPEHAALQAELTALLRDVGAKFNDPYPGLSPRNPRAAHDTQA